MILRYFLPTNCNLLTERPSKDTEFDRYQRWVTQIKDISFSSQHNLINFLSENIEQLVTNPKNKPKKESTLRKCSLSVFEKILKDISFRTFQTQGLIIAHDNLTHNNMNNGIYFGNDLTNFLD